MVLPAACQLGEARFVVVWSVMPAPLNGHLICNIPLERVALITKGADNWPSVHAAGTTLPAELKSERELKPARL